MNRPAPLFRLLLACACLGLGFARLSAQEADLRPLLDGLAHLPNASLRYTVRYHQSDLPAPTTTDYAFCHCDGAFYIKRYRHSASQPACDPDLLVEWLAFDGEVFQLYHRDANLIVMGKDAAGPRLRPFVQSLFAFHPWFCSIWHAFFLGSKELFCLPGICTAGSLFQAAPDLARVAGGTRVQLQRTSPHWSRVHITLDAAARLPVRVLTEVLPEKKETLVEVTQWSRPWPLNQAPAFIYPLHTRQTLTLLEGGAARPVFEILVDPAHATPADNVPPAEFTIPQTLARRVINLDTQTTMEIR
ncbi:hypothetical protein [Prosthecobacter sp.]|uniref:hypothetical protein n=1 Tax=Prosthecobacter sp. TaxID=1965333 RepID=UPI003783F04E